MFAVNDIETLLSIVGEPVKREHDYTLPELQQIVYQATDVSMPERSFRRIIDGLQIEKGDNGYYAPPDAVLTIGWIKNRHKYSSYDEYRRREGRIFYQQATEIDFYAC